MKKATLVIPTRDHNEDLFNCLGNLNESIDAKKWNVKVVIVDDHSSKASREELITNTVKFSIYKNLSVKPMFIGRSVGFIKCCNIALDTILSSRKQPEYVGFLHDDVKVMKNWIDNLADELDSDINVYCASSMSNSELDEHSLCSLKLPSIKTEVPESEVQNVIDSILKKDMAFDADKFQMFATLFKMDAFSKYGKFDEDNLTSIDMEKIFARTLVENKRKIRIVPTACVVHKTRMLSDENPNQLTYSKAVAVTEWINEVNDSCRNEPKRYAVYTYVRANEDLPSIYEFDDSIAYVCFTSNDALYNKRGLHFPWKIFKVDDVAEFFKFPKDSYKMKEFIKMHPHMLLKSYGISIWVDSSFNVNEDLTELSRLMNPENFMLTLDDSEYDCLYRKLIAVKESSYVTPEEFNSILQIYKWCRYPQGNGLLNSSLMIRKHLDERCKTVMSKTWNFIINTYPNDMLFLNFVLWLCKYDYSYVPMNLVIGKYLSLKENE